VIENVRLARRQIGHPRGRRERGAFIRGNSEYSITGSSFGGGFSFQLASAFFIKVLLPIDPEIVATAGTAMLVSEEPDGFY